MIDDDDDAVMQYSTEDYEAPAKKENPFNRNVPMMQSLWTGSSNADVINPQYVLAMQRRLNSMDEKFRVMSDEMRTLKQTVRQQATQIRNLQSQLNNKVDRGF